MKSCEDCIMTHIPQVDGYTMVHSLNHSGASNKAVKAKDHGCINLTLQADGCIHYYTGTNRGHNFYHGA